MRILVLAPHPDDDAIGMGGTIRHHLEQGDDVDVIYLTDGSLGITGTDPATTALIRAQEAQRARVVLQAGAPGALNIEWWKYPDGELARHHEEATVRLEVSLPAWDVAFTTHLDDDHVDHQAAARILRDAIRRRLEAGDTAPAGRTFEVWTPLRRPLHVRNIGPQAHIKSDAIRAHESQQSRQDYAGAALALNHYRGALLGRCQYAEAFGALEEEPSMNIAVCLLTWAPSLDHPRAGYARQTLLHALTHLKPGPHRLLWHIADDGSAPGHVEALQRLLADFDQPAATVTNAQRGGYGKSYNLATQALHAGGIDAILMLEDDWVLQRPLELEPLVAALADDRVECIRMGYLGFTAETIRGEIIHAGRRTYFLFDPEGDERYVLTGHPRLELVSYQRRVGPWPEGLAAGATEHEVVGRYPSRVGVVWPMDLGIAADPDWGPSLWAHIGTEGVGEVEPE